MKVCSYFNCKEKYYAKKYCRKHYRTICNNESSKRWSNIKNDPDKLNDYLKYQSEKQKIYRKKPEYKKKHNELQSKYYHDESTGRKKYIKQWKNNQPAEKKREWYMRDNYKRWFDSNREKAVERDSFKCVRCGMTRKEHYEKFNCDLHVHHIDKNGRTKKIKNNNLENLMTLCASCHRREDSIKPV